jgi:hypothetical protein
MMPLTFESPQTNMIHDGSEASLFSTNQEITDGMAISFDTEETTTKRPETTEQTHGGNGNDSHVLKHSNLNHDIRVTMRNDEENQMDPNETVADTTVGPTDSMPNHDFFVKLNGTITIFQEMMRQQMEHQQVMMQQSMQQMMQQYQTPPQWMSCPQEMKKAKQRMTPCRIGCVTFLVMLLLITAAALGAVLFGVETVLFPDKISYRYHCGASPPFPEEILPIGLPSCVKVRFHFQDCSPSSDRAMCLQAGDGSDEVPRLWCHEHDVMDTNPEIYWLWKEQYGGERYSPWKLSREKDFDESWFQPIGSRRSTITTLPNSGWMQWCQEDKELSDIPMIVTNCNVDISSEVLSSPHECYARQYIAERDVNVEKWWNTGVKALVVASSVISGILICCICACCCTRRNRRKTSQRESHVKVDESEKNSC